MAKDRKSPQGEDPPEKIGEFVSIFSRRGTWYINYQHNNRQIRRSLKTRNKKEARRKALLVEKEILAGEHQGPRRAPLLESVIKEYIQHLKAEGRSPKTTGKYDYCFKLLSEIAERSGVSRISEVDVSLVDRFRAERAAGSESRRPAKPKTVHNDTVSIRQLVNFALRRGLITDDPLRALKIKKPKRTPQPCWSRAQVDEILAATESPHREPLHFLAETGARVGEAKWLTWEDVDMDQRLIHIRPKEGWKPKSGDERVIPMNDRLYSLLSQMQRAGAWVFVAQADPSHPSTDRQISERRLLQYLKRVLRRQGLRGHLHTFRHSFISFASIAGIPERVLRKWIGHVDRETLDWYFHLADVESQQAMQRLSQAAERLRTPPQADGNSAQIQHKTQGGQNDRGAN